MASKTDKANSCDSAFSKMIAAQKISFGEELKFNKSEEERIQRMLMVCIALRNGAEVNSEIKFITM